MANSVNYFNHIATTPPFYQRRFEKDFGSETASMGKRIALLALPFLGLYRPLGSILSTSMGACRAIFAAAEGAEAAKEGAWGKCSKQVADTALALFALAATFFNFTLGLAVTTAIDGAKSSVDCAALACQQEWNKAGEEFLQTAASALYVAIILSGSLEIILAAALLQALLSCYQARKEFADGRYPEALAKIAMGVIRLTQVKDYYALIQKRNLFLSIEKNKQFFARAQKGKQVRHLLHSALGNQMHAPGTILKNSKGEPYNFGTSLHGYGKSLVKGANLTFRSKMVGGQEILELDFKVNHVFRDKLAPLLQELEQLKPQEVEDLLQFSGSHAKGIHVETVPFMVGKHPLEDATKITLDGLGTVQIGASKEVPLLYDRVVVQIDARKNIFDLHELLAFLDLDTALRQSTEEDLTRLKMGHLFRIFCPREATPLERSDAFFSLPIEQLKAEMIKRSPSFKAHLENDLPRMEGREILPGKIRYAVPGLGKQTYEMGARAVLASMMGAYNPGAAQYTTVADVLKMGLLSSETRFTNGINKVGLSSDTDFYFGSADSVFTQIITEEGTKRMRSLASMSYYSSIIFLISLDAIDTGTYQYNYDEFGNRRWEDNFWGGETYATRPSIEEFVRGQQQNPSFPHEMMFKERIAPSLIKGVIVPNQSVADALAAHLKQTDLYRDGEILGVPIEQFIRCGTAPSNSLFA